MENISVTKEEFFENLQAISSWYRLDIQEKIAVKAEEIYEDKTLVKIINNFAKTKQENDDFNKKSFLAICKNIGNKIINLNENQAHYQQIFYDLVVKEIMKK